MKVAIVLFTLIILGTLGYFFVWTPLQHTEIQDELPTTTTEEESANNDIAQTPNRPQPITTEAVPIIDTFAHPASGSVRYFEDNDLNKYIRYEDFETINGPDLFVYLATDIDASDFIDLGRLKATRGNINYEIPKDIRIEDYPHVLVWCKAFGVLFNSADLSLAL